MERFRDTEYLIDFNGDIYRDNKKLKPINAGDGYYQIGVFKNGVRKLMYIHRMVAETYIPNPNNKPQVNHINGDKGDNRVKNLEWVSSSENIEHAFKIGLRTDRGENHYKSKLSMVEVLYIRNNYIPRHKQFGNKSLSEKFNVSTSTISLIINEKNWKLK
jgi:hypothetical protein